MVSTLRLQQVFRVEEFLLVVKLSEITSKVNSVEEKYVVPTPGNKICFEEWKPLIPKRNG
jgi:hypothetical protein